MWSARSLGRQAIIMERMTLIPRSLCITLLFGHASPNSAIVHLYHRQWSTLNQVSRRQLSRDRRSARELHRYAVASPSEVIFFKKKKKKKKKNNGKTPRAGKGALGTGWPTSRERGGT